jgi:ribosome-binding protein aMBF1 (putative translation factor)
MDRARRERLERAGWRVGSSEEFLALTKEETAYAELKLRLADAVAARRRKRGLSQVRAAQLLGSSQSRVAKMEAADASVSVDLLVRALLKLGASPRDVGKAIGA